MILRECFAFFFFGGDRCEESIGASVMVKSMTYSRTSGARKVVKGRDVTTTTHNYDVTVVGAGGGTTPNRTVSGIDAV